MSDYMNRRHLKGIRKKLNQSNTKFRAFLLNPNHNGSIWVMKDGQVLILVHSWCGIGVGDYHLHVLLLQLNPQLLLMLQYCL